MRREDQKTANQGEQNVAHGPARREFLDEENVLKVYDISEPGFYTIEVCRDLIGIGNIYSNKIQIEVQ